MRKLTSEYGWTPGAIGRLTPYQAYVLCGAYCPEDGEVSMTAGEAAAMRGRRGEG